MEMMQESVIMKTAGGKTVILVPAAYKFLTIFNPTDFTVIAYGGTLNESLSNEIMRANPHNHTCQPLKESQTERRIKLVWSGGSSDAMLNFTFSDQPLPVSMPTSPSTGVADTNVTDRAGRELGKTTADVIDRPARQLGLTTSDVTDRAGRLLGVADLSDRTGREVGKVRIEDKDGVLIGPVAGHKETAAGIEDKTVKVGPGRVYSIVATVTCTINDGVGNDVYLVPANVPVNFGDRPLVCGVSIEISFSGAGDAYLQFD
jgi:hypothetical protein